MSNRTVAGAHVDPAFGDDTRQETWRCSAPASAPSNVDANKGAVLGRFVPPSQSPLVWNKLGV